MSNKVTYDGKSFIAHFGYHDRMIPKKAGFRWNPKAKKWMTDNYQVAERLADYLTKEAAEAVVQCKDAAADRLAISTAADVDNFTVPAPEGFSYFGYQKVGILQGLQRDNLLLADEMGLGKTIQALGVINGDASINRVLVVCPASLKLNWMRECETWIVRRDLPAIVLSSKHTQAMWPDAIYIVNYDILAKLTWLHDRPWDLIIADEAHAVKNPKAKRSKSFYAMAQKARKRIYMTGTPIMNRPLELYPIIRSLGWDMSWFQFTDRFCGAQQTNWNRDVSGASNLDDLQRMLRETIMIRRLKKDVLQDLPAKIRQVIALPEDDYRSVLKSEKAMQLKISQAKSQLRQQINSASSDEARKKAVQELRQYDFGTIGEIAKARKETAMAKVPAVVQICKGHLDEGLPIILFAHHKDVISALAAGLKDYGVVKVTGDMSKEDRQKSVDAFQGGLVDVFIGSITAAGVGLTLTRSSNVIFAEQDWRPGMMQQAEDRAHRIGQRESVLVQVIVIDGSIDAAMAKTLLDKERITEQSLN